MRYAPIVIGAAIALALYVLAKGLTMKDILPPPPPPDPATIQETTLADGTRCAVLFYRSAIAINCEWKSP